MDETMCGQQFGALTCTLVAEYAGTRPLESQQQRMWPGGLVLQDNQGAGAFASWDRRLEDV